MGSSAVWANASLGWQGWISLLVAVGVFVAIQGRRAIPVDVLFLGGLGILTLTGVLTPVEALAGFASPPVILIGALFAAASGLRTTGALDWIGNRLLGSAKNERGALTRLTFAVVPVSAFVLNTPLVAMFAPVVVDWCRQRGVSPSRLLIPLSYLTILGGVCTLIGTTTTLVCNAQLAAESNSARYGPEVQARVAELSFFEITAVGLPVAVIGGLYILFLAPRLLPNRVDLLEQLGQRRREYLVEMLVQADCPLAGRSVEAAGLRNLPGLFLIEIDRGDETITPVAPEDKIRTGDRLIFTGVVSTIADLEKIVGLVPAADMTYETEPAARTRRQLTEVVLSRTSPLIGKTVREADFRKRYNAAVVAVHRNGERLTNKVGNIRLEHGDTLLLQTRAEFVESHRNNREFYLVSSLGGSSARRHDRALLSGCLFLGLIAWLTVIGIWGDSLATLAFGGWELPLGNLFSNKPQPVIAICVVLAMILTRAMTPSEARAAIDLQVLITIAAALGIGAALQKSNAASTMAQFLLESVSWVGVPEAWRPFFLLCIVYGLTMIFTETITNVAVAAVMIPVSIGIAVVGGYDPRPFIIGVSLAASLSFITPIGYQTNLMVMGPGGYRPRDYLVVGTPLAILSAATALILIPIVWPLVP